MKTNIKETVDHKVHIGARSTVSPEQIVLLKSDSNYTTIILNDGSSIFSSTTMGIIEKRLEGYNFFRINRSTVVNTHYVTRTKHKKEDGVVISFSLNGFPKILKISRRRKESFYKLINAN
ncbi:MAG: LytTR family transcriptional regulator [Cytophagales bacterium]|nr:LytTR family transcriptional regulator [Cytophagales bacterium]